MEDGVASGTDERVVTLADRLGPTPTAEALALEVLQGAGAASTFHGPAVEGTLGNNSSMVDRRVRSVQPLHMAPLASAPAPGNNDGVAGLHGDSALGRSSRLAFKLMQAESVRSASQLGLPSLPPGQSVGWAPAQPSCYIALGSGCQEWHMHMAVDGTIKERGRTQT